MSNSTALRDARDALGDAETELQRTVVDDVGDEESIAALYHTQRALAYVKRVLHRRPMVD